MDCWPSDNVSTALKLLAIEPVSSKQSSQVNSLRVTSAVSDFGGERTPPEPGEGVML